MNSAKWRTIELPEATINDLVASHIYAMRGMDKREIAELAIPFVDGKVKVKIKLKEV